jgi:hypothetical protein
VTSISEEQFDRLLTDCEHESIHMETRDAYGTAVELPHMAESAAGKPDDLAWAWRLVRRAAQARRGRKISSSCNYCFRAIERLSALVSQHRIPDGRRW